MNENLKALRKACELEQLQYHLPHSNNGVVLVEKGGASYPFVNWSTPLNSHAHSFLCQDKDYFYQTFKDLVRMPRTQSYLVPKPDAQFADLSGFASVAEIVEDVESRFEYPLIIKPNRGSWGVNVSKATNGEQAAARISSIFDGGSRHYDYCALAQQYIDIECEYRAILLDGELQFAYAKSIDRAQSMGNLSPLHWRGSRAVDVNDEQVLNALRGFSSPLFDKVKFRFVGLDIAIDRAGKYWLIEANAAPGFDYYVRDCSDQKVIQLYRQLLSKLCANYI